MRALSVNIRTHLERRVGGSTQGLSQFSTYIEEKRRPRCTDVKFWVSKYIPVSLETHAEACRQRDNCPSKLRHT